MKTTVSLPELGLVAFTRALLGAGLALIVADKLDRRERRAVGWTLSLVGALSTVPLLFEVFSHRLRSESDDADKADIDETRELPEPASAPYPHETSSTPADPTTPIGSAPYPHGGSRP